MGSTVFRINARFFSIRPVIGLSVVLTLALTLFTLSIKSRLQELSVFKTNVNPAHRTASCPPKAWADGQWKYKPRSNSTKTSARTPEDAHAFAGFAGCASSRQYEWHIGIDSEEQQRKLPKVDSYQWTPKSGCDIDPLNGAALTKELVEHGGWLMVGDSITENHFFSLSCILYPHVVASPDYGSGQGTYAHDEPQHLHLSPHSPLIHNLRFPDGFDISKTPLVTYRRVDLLFEHYELVEFHRRLYAPPRNFTLFDEEVPSFSLSPAYYMRLFTKPLPEANYATLVTSTAGHWTTILFAGFQDSEKEGSGIYDLLEFFRQVTKKWAYEVQEALYEDQRKGNRGHASPRQVIVRSYLPGHEDCHEKYEPWTVYQPFKVFEWNWLWIKDFNTIFQKILSSRSPGYPNIHYLPIDQPALLRPDAHVSSDCLHLISGSGVIEGWTHYIWHFITREIGGRN